MPRRPVQEYDASGALILESEEEIPPNEFNQTQLVTAARAALAANRNFVAQTAPGSPLPALTNAQLVAQVRAQARQINALIRIVLGDFDSAD